MISGMSAGLLLGFYDFWTKKAMADNPVIPVVFWSSLYGLLLWLATLLPFDALSGLHVDLFRTNFRQQSLIIVRALSMTFSWVLAYYAMRELPMSFTGAVRASGPLWTLIGGAFLLQEQLTALQLFLVFVSVISYFALSQVGKAEGIRIFQSRPMAVMTLATILSSLTTVYDKYIIHDLEIPIYTVQAYSTFYRFVIAAALLVLAFWRRHNISLKWTLSVPLVGISWVSAEFIYFLAVESADSNATYLSVFRRMSLVVGFALSVLYLGERNVLQKGLIVSTIVVSTVALVFGYK